ncbi:hypothetical protein [Paenibacillus sp.]|uniref:hypothetical protein n=1 Tax=Paenibacillus sp. TaxID=58172 RepID=UPI00281ED8DE|nr:hypothetical protein [Paenibacillus sp.]MDR0267982.1 hypothetical protein [Paenibacillus sp.]
MRTIWKLNMISILYAVIIFLEIELLGNMFRIARITEMSIEIVRPSILIMGIGLFLVGTILIFVLLKRKFNDTRFIHFTCLLWIPYFILFVFLFSAIYPISDPGELPSDAGGLIAIAGVIVYPLYIFIVNIVGISSSGEKTA